jgi:Bacterial protein of unknown function (DUF885)
MRGFSTPSQAGKTRTPFFSVFEAKNKIVIGIAILLGIVPLGTILSAPTPDWVRRSNTNATLVLDLDRKLNPESATDDPSLDEQITDFTPGFEERARNLQHQLLQELRNRLVREKDANVREDLDILIDHVEKEIRGSELEQKYQMPYIDPTNTVLGGISRLLDDQIPVERRPKALVRLRKYAGMEPAMPPLATLAEQHIRETLSRSDLIGPPRSQVERNLSQANLVLDEMPGLFQKYGVTGYEPALAQLKKQVAQYNEFIREEVLPKSSNEFRLPSELYAFRMSGTYGVDISPGESASRGRAAFRETQTDMQRLAKEIADKRHLPARD